MTCLKLTQMDAARPIGFEAEGGDPSSETYISPLGFPEPDLTVKLGFHDLVSVIFRRIRAGAFGDLAPLDPYDLGPHDPIALQVTVQPASGASRRIGILSFNALGQLVARQTVIEITPTSNQGEPNG